ncbi:MAG: RNA polymerase sigma factor [Candidatus Kapaibacteriota bacterium]
MKRQITEYPSKEEEFEIIQKILGGEINQYEILQKKYQKPLTLLISKMIRNAEDVQDIVQETFIKAYNNLRFFKREFSFNSWLFKIASNLCIDHLRKQRIKTISIEQPFPNSNEDEKHFDFPDRDADIDVKISIVERDKILHQAINLLPEHYRKIIQLRYFEELDYQEIAENLSLPLGTVKVRLFRARKALLEILKSLSYDYKLR